MSTLAVCQKKITVLAALALFAVAVPSHIQRVHVKIIHHGMNIQTSKSSPPRIAFDEIFQVSQNEMEWRSISEKQNAVHLNEPTLRFANKSAVDSLRTRKIVLEAMVFKRGQVEGTQKIERDLAWIDELKPKNRSRLEEAERKYGTLDQDWSLPTFEKMAEQKIAEIKNEITAEEQTTSRVLVQGKIDGRSVTPADIHTADVQVRKESSGYLVTGQLELVGGLPSPQGSQWALRVFHVDDDVKKEDGRVDNHRSTYQLETANLSGAVRAQLVDTNSGNVLGEGEYRLSQFAKNEINGRAKIVIRKIENHVAGNFSSFQGYGNRMLAAADPAGRQKKGKRFVPGETRVLLASVNADAQTDADGSFQFDQIKKGSWGLLRVQSKGYAEELVLSRSGDEKRWPLFQTNMIEAMKKIVHDQKMSSDVPETGSIVLGQVVENGKPMAGVQVDTEFLEQYRPIYFSGFFPDPSLKATTENGYFAFIHLPAGAHSLVATRGKAYYSHANVVVDNETVTAVEVQATQKMEKVDIKVFDAFSGTPQIADLEMQSLSEPLKVTGYAQISLPWIDRLSFLRVAPEDPGLLQCLQVYEDSSPTIHVPLIRAQWLRNLQGSRKINLDPRAGVIVGFVSEDSFQVYLGHHAEYSQENIVYFDSQGNAVPQGVAGGGFVLFNVPTGVESVVLATDKTELLETRVVPVDSSSLVVIKFR
ncbi:MAG: hypothetical protein COT73_10835 [Bdellovibrio sp. CG10_big_fil_rev_8_21_14_0_10_47_8]|nr:MAG: hypothetical protein COT73_10835 [Bdellovibrio sp. CG10_big_fil_rev_8_21_14_0_10_47_8]